MRTCILSAIALAILSGSVVAQEQHAKSDQLADTTIPPQVWNVLRSDVLIVKTVRELPEAVRTALAKSLHQDRLEMGDHEHVVKSRCDDCVIFRLIFGGISPDGCFVHYSAIGFGPIFNIIVFDTAGQKGPRPIWAARGARSDGLDELRSLIAEGKFHSYPQQQSPHR